MASIPSGVSYLNGQYYTGGYPQRNTGNSLIDNAYGSAYQTLGAINPAVFNQYYHPVGAPQNMQQPAQQPLPTQSIQPQLNRLTQQANNALYGGLLGYNQNMPMMSGGSNPQTFAAPQGNFRDAFAGMQGLLGGNR